MGLGGGTWGNWRVAKGPHSPTLPAPISLASHVTLTITLLHPRASSPPRRARPSPLSPNQAPLVRRLSPDFPQPALRQGDGVVMEAAGRTGRAFGTTLSSKGDGRLETLGRTHPASEGMLPLSASRPARPWRGHKFPLHRHRVCKAPRPPGAPKGKAQSPASAQMQEKLWLCSTLGNLQKPLLSERDKPPTYEASSARLRRNAPSPALG